MTAPTLRIGYFADGVWGHEAFRLMAADPALGIAFVCLRWDSEDRVLRGLAEARGIPCLKEQNINDAACLERLSAFGCDLFVSMSFNQIFRAGAIHLPPRKTINCHAGKLPFYRGRNILNWALINDEKEFGITVHYIDEGIDTGDIILQRTYPIADADDYGTLLGTAQRECATLLVEAIGQIRRGEARALPQSDIHPVGFYCSQRTEGDERIRWDQGSRDLFNFIRALARPGPVARATLNGLEMRIHASRLIPDAPAYKGHAGQIVGRSGVDFVVKTSDTTLRVTEYDYDGKLRIGDRFS